MAHFAGRHGASSKRSHFEEKKREKWMTGEILWKTAEYRYNRA